MRRAVLTAALLATAPALAACDPGPPIDDAPLRVTTSVSEVEVGRAFPLTVVRTWDAGTNPDPWDESALEPLLVRLEETRRRRRDGRVEETLRYRAHALALGTVGVSAADLELSVRPQLDAAAPGPVEWPGDVLEEPPSWFSLTVGATFVVFVLALLLLALNRQPSVAAEPPTAPPAPPPQDAALRRLRALREDAVRDSDGVLAFHVELADVLRDYAHARYAVPAAMMTTEEVTAALPAGPGDDLRPPLRACDRVKFGGVRPDGEARERLLAAAERFVRETTA